MVLSPSILFQNSFAIVVIAGVLMEVLTEVLVDMAVLVDTQVVVISVYILWKGLIHPRSTVLKR